MPENTSSSPKNDSYHKDSQLFYAYAVRVNNHDYSRYILTFESAAIADKWFSLAQAEFGPGKCYRNGPQLFAFDGDAFPAKVSMSTRIQKEEGLATRWFYTQFGDAQGTNGRHVGILPVMDAEGGLVAGASGRGGSGSVGGKGKGEGEGEGEAGAGKEMMEELREIAKKNAEQISALTDALRESSQQRDDAVKKVAQDETTAQQVRSLVEAQTAAQKSSKEAADQNDKQIKALAEMQKKSQEEDRALREQNKALLEELKRQGQKKPEKPCTHDVHPKPRKIDRTVVGYDYGREGKGKEKPAMKS